MHLYLCQGLPFESLNMLVADRELWSKAKKTRPVLRSKGEQGHFAVEDSTIIF